MPMLFSSFFCLQSAQTFSENEDDVITPAAASTSLASPPSPPPPCEYILSPDPIKVPDNLPAVLVVPSLKRAIQIAHEGSTILVKTSQKFDESLLLARFC